MLVVKTKRYKKKDVFLVFKKFQKTSWNQNIVDSKHTVSWWWFFVDEIRSVNKKCFEAVDDAARVTCEKIV